MNKMENPKMTVVKFGAEDVIATSSYSVLGSEIKQYADKNSISIGSYTDNGLYQMYISGGDLTSGTYSFGTTAYTKEEAPYVYAWFEDGENEWTSEGELPNWYPSDLPQ